MYGCCRLFTDNDMYVREKAILEGADSQALLQFSGLVDLIGAVADVAIKPLLCLETSYNCC